MQQEYLKNLQKATEEIKSELEAKNQEFSSAEKELKELNTQLQKTLSTSQAQEEQSQKQIDQLNTKLKKKKTKFIEAVDWTQQLSLIINDARNLLATEGKSSNQPLPKIKLPIKNHPLDPFIKATNQLFKYVNALYFFSESENSEQSSPVSPNINFEESSTESSTESSPSHTSNSTPSNTPNITPSVTPTSTPNNTPNITPSVTPTSSPKKKATTKKVITFSSPGSDALEKTMKNF